MQSTDLTPPSDSLVGKLLVASSINEDPVLARSVSLVVHQDDENMIAVMLNRPMSPNPTALLQMLNEEPPNSESDHKDPGEDEGSDRIGHLVAHAEQTVAEVTPSVGMVHFGGPLSGPVVAVHGLSEFAEAETGDGVYVAAQRQLLENLVRTNPGPFRLIVGHLGWTLPKFAAELDQGRWHAIDATSDAVMEDDATMWPNLIRRATSSSVARWIGIPDVPNVGQWN